RGWSGKSRFNMACSVDLISQKGDEAIVQVNLLSTGIFKVLTTDQPAAANLRKTHASYKEKAIQIKRTYKFTPDRILINDQLIWLYADAPFKTFYATAA